MADDDEEDVDVNEDGQTGTDSTGATGQDTAGGDDAPDVSAQQPDEPADAGKSQPATTGEPASQSRGGARFQRLNDDNKALRDRIATLEREQQEARRQQWQNSQTVNEQQERERLALMTDSEKADYRINKMERDITARSNQDRMQLQMMLDKNAFDAKATVHPIYARYAPEVERRFQEQVAKGQPVEREVIFKFLLGERSLEMAIKGTKQAQAGRKRVDAQRTEPSSGKGDTASSRGKAGDTAEGRLKGVLI